MTGRLHKYTISEWANGHGERFWQVSCPSLLDRWGQVMPDFATKEDAIAACHKDAELKRNKEFKKIHWEEVEL